MIKPTVGRVVFYTIFGAQPEQQKHPALIAHVWSDSCVNLAVFDGNGVNYSRTSVLLIQDDAPLPPDGNYCEWMEYQKGQAAKTEELEKELVAGGRDEQRR
jgi:hypothetical protein